MPASIELLDKTPVCMSVKFIHFFLDVCLSMFLYLITSKHMLDAAQKCWKLPADAFYTQFEIIRGLSIIMLGLRGTFLGLSVVMVGLYSTT